MAFGFFKKNESADTIFIGGRIFTQNPDFPWVEAVACKDGLILGFGDYEELSELEGKHTEIIDLEGGVMLPGYIDTSGHTALNAFKESCLFLTGAGFEEVLAEISEYAAANTEKDVIFAYGFDEIILEGLDAESIRAQLDGISEDKPIIMLGKSGFHCLVNTIAMETVKAAAEEDEVKTVTVPYLLSILEPIDLNALPEAVPAAMGDYCRRGFTAVFDCGAPDFFASVYQNITVHLYQEEMLKQRFYGSLLLTCGVNPKVVMQKLSQYRTNCVEMNGHMDFKTLKLVVKETGRIDDEVTLSISEEVLKVLCMDAGDKGFDVHIDAWGEEAVDAVMEAIGSTRSGGYRKNVFTLVHDSADSSKELTEACEHMDVTELIRTADTPDDEWSCIKDATTIQEAVDMLTMNAAARLGISGGYGSVERGKHADFVIFDANPFDAKSLEEFKKLKAAMTIIDGTVVYDANEDDISQWHSMLNTWEEE
jgi:Predicted metal-dependent hydrolase with the TIM-barrel fold